MKATINLKSISAETCVKTVKEAIAHNVSLTINIAISNIVVENLNNSTEFTSIVPAVFSEISTIELLADKDEELRKNSDKEAESKKAIRASKDYQAILAKIFDDKSNEILAKYGVGDPRCFDDFIICMYGEKIKENPYNIIRYAFCECPKIAKEKGIQLDKKFMQENVDNYDVFKRYIAKACKFNNMHNECQRFPSIELVKYYSKKFLAL